MMVHTEAMLFRDRADAAGRLAEQLKARELVDPVVLAIPRGGVVIGAVLARCLGAELDVVLARKLRAPYQSEFAIGAVSEDGRMTLNPEAWDVPGVSSWGKSPGAPGCSAPSGRRRRWKVDPSL